jgi:hypothetical protein
MSLSNYEEPIILDYILEDDLYIALCTAAPTDASTGATITEVADAGAYARAAIGAADWDAAVAGSKTTGNAITFTTATGDWGTVTHFAILDSAVHGAGNVIMWGALTGSKVITSGDAFRFPAGQLTVTLD